MYEKYLLYIIQPLRGCDAMRASMHRIPYGAIQIQSLRDCPQPQCGFKYLLVFQTINVCRERKEKNTEKAKKARRALM